MDYSKHNDILIPINAQCNLDCHFCMLRGLKKRRLFKNWKISYRAFQQFVIDCKKKKQYKRLIISGAEPTLHPEIETFLEFAHDYFIKIQMQTNGILLENKKFTKRVASYCEEFFITILGDKSRLHDSLVNSKGAFKRVKRAIDNLNYFGSTLIANIVITRLNYKNLSLIVDFLYKNNFRHVHFWFFNTFGNRDAEDLLVNVSEVKFFLEKAIDLCRSRKIKVVVKFFPVCVLNAKYRQKTNYYQPTLVKNKLIEEWFCFRSGDFLQCRLQKICKYKKCDGLGISYLNKFGYKDLRPLR